MKLDKLNDFNKINTKLIIAINEKNKDISLSQN